MIESTEYLKDDEINAVLAKYAGILGYTRKYTWEWNSNLRTTMGLAWGYRDHMEFGQLTFIPATPFQRLETIVHELCHLVRFWENSHCDGPNDPIWVRNKRGHDQRWKFLMMLCGFRGDRCHEVIPLGSKRRR